MKRDNVSSNAKKNAQKTDNMFNEDEDFQEKNIRKKQDKKLSKHFDIYINGEKTKIINFLFKDFEHFERKGKIIQLISKSDFLKNGETINAQKIRGLKFKPIFDGEKIAYNLNGTIYSKGNVKNKKETGFWQYWYPNGTKAREGEFIDGIPNGTHKYWFENGKLRSIGNWKFGSYDGTWEIYDEDGKEKVLKNYKEGKLIEN